MIIIPEQLPDDHNTRDITPSSLYYYYYFMLTIPRKLYLMFCYTRAITRANSGRGYVIADGDLVLLIQMIRSAKCSNLYKKADSKVPPPCVTTLIMP